MVQLGQVVQMKSKSAGGEALWGYRFRVGGRGSRRVQRGGFQSERDAGEALERALERLRRVMEATRCGLPPGSPSAAAPW